MPTRINIRLLNRERCLVVKKSQTGGLSHLSLEGFINKAELQAIKNKCLIWAIDCPQENLGIILTLRSMPVKPPLEHHFEVFNKVKFSVWEESLPILMFKKLIGMETLQTSMEKVPPINIRLHLKLLTFSGKNSWVLMKQTHFQLNGIPRMCGSQIKR